MSITIKEAMELKEFKDFKAIAGKKSLTNKIKKVGILDHETKEMIEKDFEEGEFVISTLLNIKDKIEELYEIVEKLILVGASGLAIKSVYFDTVPDEVIKLANKESFPILMFSNVYFEDVITSVMDAIKEKRESESLVLKIDNILYSNLNDVIIKRIAYEINSSFREKNIIVFCKRRSNDKLGKPMISLSLEHDKALKKYNKIIPYKDGYLIINTFDDINTNEIRNIILRRLEALGFSFNDYIIGVSSLHEKLEKLNVSIKESMCSFKHSITYKKDISFFNDIGIDKVLIPLIDNPWIQKYYDEMITPLLIYDKKNETDLLRTAIIYVENNGDIKASSEKLFQHGNTIRYRIDRIYKILNKNCDIKHFYEELAMAVRIHNLIELSL